MEMPVPGKAPSRAGLPAGSRGHPRVDVVDQLAERRIEAVARLRQVDRDLGHDAAGIGGEDQDAVAHQHRFLDVVRDHAGSTRSACGLRSTGRAGRCAASRRSARRAPRTARPSAAPWDGPPARGRARPAGACRPTAPSDRRSRSRRGRSGRWRPARACGARPGSTRCASRPISTFSSTVSQGNSAKLWNTMATSAAGPATSAPADRDRCRRSAGIRPAMMRSSVDLPQPERPSSATISSLAQRQVDVVEHEQVVAAALAIELAHVRRPRRAGDAASGRHVRVHGGLSSIEAEAALGQAIERPPEQAVEGDDEDRHHGDAEHDARIVAGRGGLGDVGAEARRPRAWCRPSSRPRRRCWRSTSRPTRSARRSRSRGRCRAG